MQTEVNANTFKVDKLPIDLYVYLTNFDAIT